MNIASAVTCNGLLAIIAMLSSLLLPPSCTLADERDGGITSLSQILPDRPWPERRKEIERRWLELLGGFPT